MIDEKLNQLLDAGWAVNLHKLYTVPDDDSGTIRQTYECSLSSSIGVASGSGDSVRASFNDALSKASDLVANALAALEKAKLPSEAN